MHLLNVQLHRFLHSPVATWNPTCWIRVKFTFGSTQVRLGQGKGGNHGLVGWFGWVQSWLRVPAIRPFGRPIDRDRLIERLVNQADRSIRSMAEAVPVAVAVRASGEGWKERCCVVAPRLLPTPTPKPIHDPQRDPTHRHVPRGPCRNRQTTSGPGSSVGRPSSARPCRASSR